MDITQKQFEKAKQQFNLEVKQDDKYTKELATQTEDGCLTYRKSGETYLAFGSVAEWLRGDSEASEKMSDTEKSVDSMTLDDIEFVDDVSDMIWSQVDDGLAVEDSRIFYLSSKYKGARKILISKPSSIFAGWQVVSIPDNPNKSLENLGQFNATSFEDVLSQMGYDIQEET